MNPIDWIHQKELTLISQLQDAVRGPVLDRIMIFFNYFDSFPFFVFIMMCAWFGYSHKWGIRLVFLCMISSLVNNELKELFAQPRPVHLQPELGLLFAQSYGIPSGAAQGMVTLFGFLALAVKKKWFWIVSILFILSVSFSRVYLGLHFFSDIIAGWIVGFILLIIYWRSLPRIEKFLVKKSKQSIVLISALATVLLSLVCLKEGMILTLIFGFGLSCGCVFGPKFIPPQKIAQRMIRPVIALIGIFLLHLAADSLRFPPAQPFLSFLSWSFAYFITGLWVSAGMSFLSRVI